MNNHYWFYAIAFVVALAAIIFFAKQNHECNQDGGTYVRTFWGMECI